MNEAVGVNNCLTMDRGKKRSVCPFRRQELWKYIGCILLAVTYGNKGHKPWSEVPKTFGNKAINKLQRNVCGDTYLNKVWCDLCRLFYIYACH